MSNARKTNREDAKSTKLLPKVERRKLAQMRKRHFEWLFNWRLSGRRTTFWTCPACKQANEGARPRRREVGSTGCWDSLTTCLHCGQLSMVSTYPDGRVDVDCPDADSAPSAVKEAAR